MVAVDMLQDKSLLDNSDRSCPAESTHMCRTLEMGFQRKIGGTSKETEAVIRWGPALVVPSLAGCAGS